jgi:hypothetical protein
LFRTQAWPIAPDVKFVPMKFFLPLRFFLTWINTITITPAQSDKQLD